jgi:hypothetical protein
MSNGVDGFYGFQNETYSKQACNLVRLLIDSSVLTLDFVCGPLFVN